MTYTEHAFVITCFRNAFFNTYWQCFPLTTEAHCFFNPCSSCGRKKSLRMPLPRHFGRRTVLLVCIFLFFTVSGYGFFCDCYNSLLISLNNFTSLYAPPNIWNFREPQGGPSGSAGFLVAAFGGRRCGVCMLLQPHGLTLPTRQIALWYVSC